MEFQIPQVSQTPPVAQPILQDQHDKWTLKHFVIVAVASIPLTCIIIIFILIFIKRAGLT